MTRVAASRWTWFRTWLLRVTEFGAVQTVVQGLNAVAGLVIVHSLSKSEYALFAIANSMQSTCNLLAELGIGIGLRSIGGRVCTDKARFGQLINTAIGLRWYFAKLSILFCVPVAAWMLWRNQADFWTIVGLCLLVAFGVIPLLAAAVWTVSLQLHGEYRQIQKIDSTNAAIRLLLIGGLALSKLNSLLAMSVGVIGNWIQAHLTRRWGQGHADSAAAVNIEDRKTLLALSLRALPNTLFFCFQGQMILLILTLQGSPTAIADITALGRLAALLAVFSSAFTNILAPRFARCQDPARLPGLYLLLLGGTVAILAPLVLAVWIIPGPLLWLLGGSYAGLESECSLVVSAGCVGQLAGVMWGLNSSRAWVRVLMPTFIPFVLLVQAGAASQLDLSVFHDVLIFSLVTAGALIPIYAVDAWIGISREKRNSPQY